MTVKMKDNVPQECYGIKSNAEWKKGVEYNEGSILESQLVYNDDAEYCEDDKAKLNGFFNCFASSDPLEQIAAMNRFAAGNENRD